MNKDMSRNKDQVFDLIVIGTGTAASTTALECSSLGWKVGSHNRFTIFLRDLCITWM
jgi:pyruvate/2-oxoglutarate dehydrogenase complex dihydrolipoamide dehydrogenase (E3) component